MDRTRVVAAVTAVPNRLDAAEEVVEQLRSQGCFDVELLVWEGEVGYRGMVANERRAFEFMLSTDAEWGLLLHDDTVIADDFQSKVLARLDEAEEQFDARAVSFFMFGEQTKAKGERWLKRKGKTFRNEQALALDSGLIQGLVDYSWTHGHEFKHTDMLISTYLARHEIDVYNTVPDLVNHRLEIPSTVGHNPVIFGRERASKSFSPEGT